MFARIPLALALLVGACASKDSVSLDDSGDVSGADSDPAADDSSAADDSAADDSEDVQPDCEVTIESIDPSDGAEDLSTTPSLTASLSGPVASDQASAVLEGPDGAVDGELGLEADGARLRFTPATELDRDAEYTITFSVCDDVAEASFRTVGAPQGEALEGHVYDVDLTQVTWSQPPNGSLLAGFLTSAHLLFYVEDVDASARTIDFVGALGEEDPDLQQDICTEPFDFDAADFSADPAFSVGPADTSFEAQGVALNVYGLIASGAFSADGEALRNMRVRGAIDVGDFEFQGASVCDYAEFLLGAPCVSCPDGGDGCLELDVVSSTAPRVDGVSFDPANNPADHAECN